MSATNSKSAEAEVIGAEGAAPEHDGAGESRAVAERSEATVAARRDDNVAGPAALMSVILRAASDPSVDIEKMERLMAMHERMDAKRAEAEFNDSMCQAQAEMSPIAADATNLQTHSKYPTYAALDRALRPIYTSHGFSVSFDTEDAKADTHVRVIAIVGHRGGFTRRYRADISADGKGAKGGDVMTLTHAAGSAFTYGQRYLLKLVFNVAVGEDDNDGNGASPATLNEDQLEHVEALLKGLIERAPTNEKKFFDYISKVANLEITSPEQIPQHLYQKAIQTLNEAGGHV